MLSGRPTALRTGCCIGSISAFIAANLILSTADGQLQHAVTLNLLYRVHQRRQSLNSHFEPVAGFNRTDAAGRAGENYVAGQERHVRGNETHDSVAVEDKLVRIRVLAKLAVLKKLNRQIMRISFRFDVRPQRRECVEGLGTRPLAFAILNRAVTDVLSGSVTENVTGGGGRRHIAYAPANDDAEFRFEISAMI